jgi:hypothetical protein
MQRAGKREAPCTGAFVTAQFQRASAYTCTCTVVGSVRRIASLLYFRFLLMTWHVYILNADDRQLDKRTGLRLVCTHCVDANQVKTT